MQNHSPFSFRFIPVLVIAGIVVMMFLVIGCDVVPVTGTVQLPEGSKLALTDLRIVTCVGEAPVKAEGSFRARESGSSPALAFATDSTGKPTLLGFVSGETSGTGSEISAQSTAVALLFQALSAFTLPRDAWPQALTLLTADPSTATLAKVVAARLAANPYAISDNDTELLSALNSAVTAILGSTIAPALTASRTAACLKSFDVRVTSTAEETALVLVQPTDENSGVRVAPNAAGNGITITNSFRRHLWAYVYRTGWKTKDDDENAAPHDITPWERVVPGTVVSGYIPAVNGFQGTIGTILDAVSGQVAYSPVTSDAIILPVSPADANQTFYKVIVVGPSWKSGGFNDELPTEYSAMSEAGEWRSAELKMNMLTIFQEFLFPALLSVFPAEALGEESE